MWACRSQDMRLRTGMTGSPTRQMKKDAHRPAVMEIPIANRMVNANHDLQGRVSSPMPETTKPTMPITWARRMTETHSARVFGSVSVGVAVKALQCTHGRHAADCEPTALATRR